MKKEPSLTLKIEEMKHFQTSCEGKRLKFLLYKNPNRAEGQIKSNLFFLNSSEAHSWILFCEGGCVNCVSLQIVPCFLGFVHISSINIKCQA